MKKTLGIAALLMAMLLLLTACGNSIEGTWNYVDGTGEGAESFSTYKALGANITFTFKSGKMTIKMEIEGQSDSMENTYKIDGNKITITTEGSTDGTTGEFKVDGKKLTLTIEGSTLNFEKK